MRIILNYPWLIVFSGSGWIWMEEGGTLVSTVDSQRGGPGFESSVEFPFVYAGYLRVLQLQCNI